MQQTSSADRGQPAPYTSVAVVGAGPGTALAIVAAANAERVLVWARESEVVEAIAKRRENSHFLPGVVLPACIEPTADIARVKEAEAVLLVAPAQHVRGVLAEHETKLAQGTPVVLCAKGIETGTGLLLTEVLSQLLPEAEPAFSQARLSRAMSRLAFRRPSPLRPGRLLRRGSR